MVPVSFVFLISVRMIGEDSYSFIALRPIQNLYCYTVFIVTTVCRDFTLLLYYDALLSLKRFSSREYRFHGRKFPFCKISVPWRHFSFVVNYHNIRHSTKQRAFDIPSTIGIRRELFKFSMSHFISNNSIAIIIKIPLLLLLFVLLIYYHNNITSHSIKVFSVL